MIYVVCWADRLRPTGSSGSGRGGAVRLEIYSCGRGGALRRARRLSDECKRSVWTAKQAAMAAWVRAGFRLQHLVQFNTAFTTLVHLIHWPSGPDLFTTRISMSTSIWGRLCMMHTYCQGLCTSSSAYSGTTLHPGALYPSAPQHYTERPLLLRNAHSIATTLTIRVYERQWINWTLGKELQPYAIPQSASAFENRENLYFTSE